MQIEENSLVIIKDNEKNAFLKRFRKNKQLYNINIIGLNEFIKRYFFNYDSEAIYSIHKKYNVIKSVAEIYASNLIYIRDIENSKIHFLTEIKEYLQFKNLLKENKEFKNYLKSKTIVLYNLKNIDNFYLNIFEDLKEITRVIYLEDEDNISNHELKPLYKLPNREIEFAFIAEKIVSLIKKGIDINKIKIANLNSDDNFVLEKTFKDFNIPIELDNQESIESTILANKFKSIYSKDIMTSLETLKDYIKDQKDEEIYKELINLINNYNWCENYEEVKEFVFDDLTKIKLKNTLYKNAIRIIDFPNETVDNSEYLFLINFNQGTIPVTKSDEDYLNDETKIKLGMSDSIDLNKKNIQNVQNAIKNTNNIYITYRERDINGELYISESYTPEIFKEEEYKLVYNSSNNFNKKILIKEKDEFRKYGTTSELLKKLNYTYPKEEYLNYDNSFKGIDKTKISTSLNSHLTLSYSSMNTYYKCAFRYYLDNILKVNKFEDTFEITIGNIFHDILSKAFKSNFDFENSWELSLKRCEYEFNISEKFFLNLLKSELEFIIETINKQSSFTELKKSLYEQKIEIVIDQNTTFKGFVDKILYDDFDTKQIVSIIDYKTGNPELSLDNVIYGLDMQLPIYAFLISKSNIFKNVHIGGFYLQKIISDKKNIDDKMNSLKLQGYTNSNEEIIKLVDNTYSNSELIKSMKKTSNGLSAYSKVLSDREIEKLIEIVEHKIKEASYSIFNGNFQINPKEIAGKQEGCKFCKYKDICFMKNSDIIKLKKANQKEILGSDNYANVD